MTTKQLFNTIHQIYLNKTILKSTFENYDLIISSHDNYYIVSNHKPNGTQIKFKIEVKHSIISNSEYLLHYRFLNTNSKIAQSNTTSTKEQIPQLIQNLVIPIIREMKIDTIIN